DSNLISDLFVPSTVDALYPASMPESRPPLGVARVSQGPSAPLRSIGEPDPPRSGPEPGDATWAKCGRLVDVHKIPISFKSSCDTPNVSNGTSTGTDERMSPYFE